jgi:hypothetical protein
MDVIDGCHIRLEGVFLWSTSKAVKNGSMAGFISNENLTQLFWNCFWLFLVVDSILREDMDS